MRKVCEISKAGSTFSGRFRARVVYDNGAEFGFDLEGTPLLSKGQNAARAAIRIAETMMNVLVLKERCEFYIERAEARNDGFTRYELTEIRKARDALWTFLAVAPQEQDGFKVLGGRLGEAHYAALGDNVLKMRNSFLDTNPETAEESLVAHVGHADFRLPLLTFSVTRVRAGERTYFDGIESTLKAFGPVSKNPFLIRMPNTAALRAAALNRPEPDRQPEPAASAPEARAPSPAQSRAERSLAFQERNAAKIRKEILPGLTGEERRVAEERLNRVETHIARKRAERAQFALKREVEGSLYALEVQSGAGAYVAPSPAAPAPIEAPRLGDLPSLKSVRLDAERRRFVLPAAQAADLAGRHNSPEAPLKVDGERVIITGTGRVFEASGPMARRCPWIRPGQETCYVYYEKAPAAEARPEPEEDDSAFRP